VLVDLVADQQHLGWRQQIGKLLHFGAVSTPWHWGCAGVLMMISARARCDALRRCAQSLA
jgi:hypothetical protein